MRRGFFTRATEIADPDFVDVPVDRLDLEGPCRRAGPHRSATEPRRAQPSPRSRSSPSEGNDTTHLSTLDADGNAVALTYTLEEGYGSKAVVAGAGFLLNNEMGDFNLIPGRTDPSGRIGTPANLIAPGKRMLSSQSPTIVLKDGKVRLVTGSPGGRTIPNTTLWVVLNVLEFGLEPRAAVDAPRTHHPWFPDVLTLEGPAVNWPEATRDALGRARPQGSAWRNPGRRPHDRRRPRQAERSMAIADRRRQTSRASGRLRTPTRTAPQSPPPRLSVAKFQRSPKKSFPGELHASSARKTYLSCVRRRRRISAFSMTLWIDACMHSSFGGPCRLPIETGVFVSRDQEFAANPVRFPDLWSNKWWIGPRRTAPDWSPSPRRSLSLVKRRNRA